MSQVKSLSFQQSTQNDYLRMHEASNVSATSATPMSEPYSTSNDASEETNDTTPPPSHDLSAPRLTAADQSSSENQDENSSHSGAQTLTESSLSSATSEEDPTSVSTVKNALNMQDASTRADQPPLRTRERWFGKYRRQTEPRNYKVFSAFEVPISRDVCDQYISFYLDLHDDLGAFSRRLELLEGACGATSLRLASFGSSKDTAEPCILVGCPREYVKHMRKYFMQPKIKRLIGSLKVCIIPSPPERTVKPLTVHLWSKTRSEHNPDPPERMAAISDDELRIATVGGFVEVYSAGVRRLCGMTCHHSFQDETAAPSVHEDHGQYEYYLEAGDDDDDDGNSVHIIAGVGDEGVENDTNSDFAHNQVFNEHSPHLQGSLSRHAAGEASEFRSQLQSQRKEAFARTANCMGPGNINVDQWEPAGSSNYHDYVLIDLAGETEARVRALCTPAHQTTVQDPSSYDTPIPANLSSHRLGYPGGRLDPTPSALFLPKSGTFIKTYQFILDSSKDQSGISLGDSGIWVVSASNEILGQLVAKDPFGSVHVVPMTDILKDLIQRFPGTTFRFFISNRSRASKREQVLNQVYQAKPQGQYLNNNWGFNSFGPSGRRSREDDFVSNNTSHGRHNPTVNKDGKAAEGANAALYHFSGRMLSKQS